MSYAYVALVAYLVRYTHSDTKCVKIGQKYKKISGKTPNFDYSYLIKLMASKIIFNLLYLHNQPMDWAGCSLKL